MRSLEEYLNGLIGYKVDEPYREMARIKSVLISMRFSIPDELKKFEEFRDALETHKTTINNINLSIMVADILNLISEEIEVANLEKKVPLQWINEAKNGVTEEMLRYLRPLVKGEMSCRYKDGVPDYLIL